jgi:adenylate cyclase
MLKSEAFAASTRLQRFLRHVVEQSLAGKGDELKEYVIGTSVFDRDEQYDPRIDSIVRVEAGRLRAKLDEYYNGAGGSDDVVIRIPRGTYAPVFERRASEQPPLPATDPSPAARSTLRWRPVIALVSAVFAAVAITATTDVGRVFRPGPEAVSKDPAYARVAVLPFTQYSTDPAVRLLAARLTDGVTAELSRLTTISVVSHTSALQFENARKPLKEIARALNANAVVEASVDVEGDAVHVQLRLVDAAVDRKSFIQEIEGSRAALPDLERRVARAIEADVTRTLTPARR